MLRPQVITKENEAVPKRVNTISKYESIYAMNIYGSMNKNITFQQIITITQIFIT